MPTVSVVIITYARPAYLRECLEHLAKSATTPHEVVVVDGSPDERTRDIVRADFDQVRLVQHSLGPGTMPESRQLGLEVATGDVVAFIDDDAYVDRDWLDHLAAAYGPGVGGVGGRALNGQPGEESRGLGSIGRLLPDGTITGNFAADPGRTIVVDHLLGANMSFRRSVLEQIGGVRGRYPGTCACEDTDISLRVRQQGLRLVFEPRAVVRHVAAPYQTGGQRFDRRYQFYSRRNHVLLLARTYGWRAEVLRRYLWSALRSQRGYLAEAWRRVRHARSDGRAGGGLLTRLTGPVVLARSAAELGGLLAGLVAIAGARRTDRAEGVGTP